MLVDWQASYSSSLDALRAVAIHLYSQSSVVVIFPCNWDSITQNRSPKVDQVNRLHSRNDHSKSITKTPLIETNPPKPITENRSLNIQFIIRSPKVDQVYKELHSPSGIWVIDSVWSIFGWSTLRESAPSALQRSYLTLFVVLYSDNRTLPQLKIQALWCLLQRIIRLVWATATAASVKLLACHRLVCFDRSRHPSRSCLVLKDLSKFCITVANCCCQQNVARRAYVSSAFCCGCLFILCFMAFDETDAWWHRC